MITKKERKEAEALARSMYQDILKVDIKEDPDDESSLLLNVTRGKVMPTVCIDRTTNKIRKKART